MDEAAICVVLEFIEGDLASIFGHIRALSLEDQERILAHIEDIVQEQIEGLRFVQSWSDTRPAHEDAQAVRYEMAGKLGPWARGGCEGERFLDIGLQGKPEYRRIRSAEKERTWRSLSLVIETGPGLISRVSRWCSTNVYKRAGVPDPPDPPDPQEIP